MQRNYVYLFCVRVNKRVLEEILMKDKQKIGSAEAMEVYNRILLLTRLVYGNFTRMSRTIGRSQASFERYRFVLPSDLVMFNIQRTTGFSSRYIVSGEGYPLANNRAGFFARKLAVDNNTIIELEALSEEGPPFDLENPDFSEEESFRYKANYKNNPSEYMDERRGRIRFGQASITDYMSDHPGRKKSSAKFPQGFNWVQDQMSNTRVDDGVMNELFSIPLYDVNARANIGSLTSFDDLPVSTVKLAVGLRLNPIFTVGMKVRGDSMIDAGIVDGSIVLIDKSKTPFPGSGIACLYNGVLLIKVYEHDENNNVVLQSKNSEVAPIIIKENDTFEIIGVIRAVLSHWG